MLIIIAGCASPQRTRPTGTPPVPQAALARFGAKTSGMDKRDGLIPVYLDRKTGKVLLEIPRDSLRVLFLVTLATGLGSNPIGLDRGANAGEYVTRFDRNGERVLVVFENWSYRSSASDNSSHQRTVAESFPPSTVAALPLVAEDGGRLLVDATEFLFRDWADVSTTLAQANEGSYSVARERSSIYEPNTKGFPRNTEIDIALTFMTAGRPGGIVSTIVPDGRAFTLRQHVSFAQLPDDSYKPRILDPRVGFFGIAFRDYAQPIDGSLEQRWIARHRLARANPADPGSTFVNPIVYYVDRGIPEPMRSATLAGANFWVEAFDRAGLRGGFRVELLPEGVDPMDIRYNVVQWVNRHERGWSIGGSLGDPRTGEILKGMARMDSHRARTSYNLYAGLMGAATASADTAFVLGRVRQVTAHEIGHTLGMAHNYIASSYERGSVMDYPPPRVRLDKAGNIDVSDAYDLGPGDYDVWAIRWGYGIFPPESEKDSLQALVSEGFRKGYLFLSDADARPEFASDPRTNLWDDAPAPVEFLGHQLAVRRVALARFGERNIRAGEPVALLQERFAPVYLMHRFAINSVAKAIGGMEYSSSLAGDGLQATVPVSGERQRAALSALMRTLQPTELSIPDTVLTLLAPRPFSYTPYVELFRSRTRPTFDEFGAARTLAQMVVDAILQRERAARLVQFAAGDPRTLSLSETLDSLVATTWNRSAGPASRSTGKTSALRSVARRALVDRLLSLAADREAAPEVRALVEYRLAQLRNDARDFARRGGSEMERAHWSSIAADLTRWIERRELPAPTPALMPPPGDPFGEDPEV
ncbi:MAG: zinc-dependent metalloprotease [Gemmatimonadaceae bacterium]